MATQGVNPDDVLKGLEGIHNYIEKNQDALKQNKVDPVSMAKEIAEAAHTIETLRKITSGAVGGDLQKFRKERGIPTGRPQERKQGKVQPSNTQLKVLYEKYQSGDMSQSEINHYFTLLSNSKEYLNLRDKELRDAVIYWRATRSGMGDVDLRESRRTHRSRRSFTRR